MFKQYGREKKKRELVTETEWDIPGAESKDTVRKQCDVMKKSWMFLWKHNLNCRNSSSKLLNWVPPHLSAVCCSVAIEIIGDATRELRQLIIRHSWGLCVWSKAEESHRVFASHAYCFWLVRHFLSGWPGSHGTKSLLHVNISHKIQTL